MSYLRRASFLLIVAFLVSPAAAQFQSEVPSLGGFLRDRVWTRGQGAEQLRVVTTHANRTGNQYVAYVRLSWGDLASLTGATGPRTVTWKGKLEVDDGQATVVRTDGFEKLSTQTAVVDREAYAAFVRQWQAKHDAFVKKATQARIRQRREALATIDDKEDLLKRLAKIDKQYEKKLEKFTQRMQRALAEKRQELGRTVTSPADRITRHGGDEVEWVSVTRRGDVDSVLIKLIVDDDDSEVEIKVGDLKVEFDLRAAPAYESGVVRETVIGNGDYDRRLYGWEGRDDDRYTSSIRTYRYSTSSWPSGWSIYVGGYPYYMYYRTHPGYTYGRYTPYHSYRPGLYAYTNHCHRSFGWTGGRFRLRVEDSNRDRHDSRRDRRDSRRSHHRNRRDD